MHYFIYDQAAFYEMEQVQNSAKLNYMEGSVPKEVKAPGKSCNRTRNILFSGRQMKTCSIFKHTHQIGINNLCILFMIAYPDKPSVAYTLGKPSTKPFANMG